jgi:hypothetical protein
MRIEIKIRRVLIDIKMKINKKEMEVVIKKDKKDL